VCDGASGKITAVRMVSDGDDSEERVRTCPLDVVAGVNGTASSVGRTSVLSPCREAARSVRERLSLSLWRSGSQGKSPRLPNHPYLHHAHNHAGQAPFRHAG